MEPFQQKVKQIASEGAQSAFANVMSLITLVCNSTMTRYGHDEHQSHKSKHQTIFPL
jgi:hypothetical protein